MHLYAFPRSILHRSESRAGLVPLHCSAMALRVLAAVFLGAAAWQCAFVTTGAGPTRSPQVSMHAAAGQSQAAEQENVMSPVVSLGIGA
eukprot:s14519_g1.t1